MRYKRYSFEDTLRVAMALKSDCPLYVFPVYGGYRIYRERPPFGAAYYKVEKGEVVYCPSRQVAGCI